MRWFRWYRGASENPKFHIVARRANRPSSMGEGDRVLGAVTVTDVLALWVTVLEDAADDEHWGTCSKDAEFIAAVLHLNIDDVDHILDAMVDVGLLDTPTEAGYHVTKWEQYQYASDRDPTNAARQQRYRNAHSSAHNGRKRKRNALRKRPDTETETDTEKKKEERASHDADASPDVRTMLFNSGLDRLARITGKTPSSCRSLIGRWLKQVDDEAVHVLAAIDDAVQERVADPVAWINARLAPHRKERGHGGNRKGSSIIAAADQLVERIRQFDAGAGGDEGEATLRLLPKR